MNVATIDAEGQRTEVGPAFEHVIERPVEPFTAWRGARVASKGRGMSWSLHRGVAVTFADGHAALGIDSAVWRTVIDPHAVLATFGDDRETAVVVNPNMLRDVVLDEMKRGRERPPLGSR